MTTTVTIAPVRKSIRVSASQDHAFDVFTSGLGRWWPRKASIGNSPLKMAVMEPRLGGRWYELGEDGSQTDVGKVLVWEPPQRFVISWDINSNWKPDTTVGSEVEVQIHRRRARRNAGGAGAPQVRTDGRGGRRIPAQGCRRRLAPHAGALQARSRDREPLERFPAKWTVPAEARKRKDLDLRLHAATYRSDANHEEHPMSIELYVFPPSPRAFKVMAVANHLGLDCTLRIVDLTKGEQNTPQYAALNPNMRMPTLKDGDQVVWESNAICQYLAAKKPESGLLPKDETARLDVTRWQFWDLAHWDPTCAVFVFEYVVKPFVLRSGEPDMAAIAKGTEAFHRAGEGAGRAAQGQAVRHRRYPDGRGFLARRGDEARRHGALPARALRRDQALVRDAERAPGLAEDAGANRDARRQRGVIRVYSGAAASMPAITVTNATASQIRSG